MIYQNTGSEESSQVPGENSHREFRFIFQVDSSLKLQVPGEYFLRDSILCGALPDVIFIKDSLLLS